MPNPLKRDPSKTTMIRKRFIADMNRRFKKISKAIQQLVVDDDVFGLIESKLLTFQEKQAFRFLSDANKVKEYRKWLQQQIDANVLTIDAISGKPWTSTYVESTYRKAMLKSYSEVHKEALAESSDFYLGGKAQFIREAFSSPIVLSKVELLYTRAFDELKGVTDAMSQQMSRILADGLVQGKGPLAIARDLRKNVTNITKRRARTIARTEIIRVHAEGQLDAYERLGVEEVNLLAEWLTAGDERVCPECDSMASSGPYKIEEARGLIPAHPNCRCTWVPYIK